MMNVILAIAVAFVLTLILARHLPAVLHEKSFSCP